MAVGGDAGVAAPVQEDPDRPTFLELFFDLAFVFALIALAERLAARLTWAGTGQTLVSLLAIALIWALTAWSGDVVDLRRPELLPRLIWGMAGTLVLAAAVPEAYGHRGLLFGITIASIHLGTGLYYLLILRTPVQRIRTQRILAWETLAGVGWISGGLLAGTGRPVLWAVALAVEYLGAALGWPTPWSRHPLPNPEARAVGERITERYRQFVIVALGASIFVAAKSFSQNAYTVGRGEALLVVFLVTVLLWRIYIYRAGELMTVTVADSADPTRLSRSAAYAHLIIVTGIVGVAAASHLVVHRPYGDTPPSWAAIILGGPALFLIGRFLLDHVVFAGVSRARLAGLLLLAGLIPATRLLPPIMVALAVVAVLALVATLNLIEVRKRPLTPAPRQQG